MFTGIVQTMGRVASWDGQRLEVEVSDAWPGDPFQMGESVAVQGVCLTTLSTSSPLVFELSEETVQRTNLRHCAVGHKVNLERAMRPSDRLGGHIVQGHVDQVGTALAVEERDGWWQMRFDGGTRAGRYLVDKGSIAVDGVSLTVVAPDGDTFGVAVIPHTFEVTTLGRLRAGDSVNVEFDVLAKHVENLVAYRAR